MCNRVLILTELNIANEGMYASLPASKALSSSFFSSCFNGWRILEIDSIENEEYEKKLKTEIKKAG